MSKVDEQIAFIVKYKEFKELVTGMASSNALIGAFGGVEGADFDPFDGLEPLLEEIEQGLNEEAKLLFKSDVS